ncbi:MAG: SIS domain-containing protein [Anaerolineaceae bacterium]|nr:SIS domain-containing protein [Anaerolineaceae bacterium]
MDFDKIDLKWQNMLAGITAQVPFVQNSPKSIYTNIKESLALKEAPEKVFLTGCGDSLYCGMAARFAFQEWSGIQTEAVYALEFSRYLVKHAPKNSLVLAVSNSGIVSRTMETLIQGRKYGLITIAATSNLKEGISQEAEFTIDLAYSERRFAPGTSSYMASLIVQFCLAIYLAEVNGKFSPMQVEEKLSEISALSDAMQSTIDANLPIMESLVKQINLQHKIIFIGAGPNHGTAHFSMAKVIEASLIGAVGQELEEWAHEQYFITDENTYTFVLAQPGASVERAREQIMAVKDMGSKCIVICDPQDEETAAMADIVAPVHGTFDEMLSPILYCIPAEIFAFHFAVEHNTVMLGFNNPKVKEVNFRQIFGSKILR